MEKEPVCTTRRMLRSQSVVHRCLDNTVLVRVQDEKCRTSFAGECPGMLFFGRTRDADETLREDGMYCHGGLGLEHLMMTTV